MILYFAVRNFRCFADEVVLDLAPKLRTNLPPDGATWRNVTERTAAVFGPNASGKSTLLDAMKALAVALQLPGSSAIRQPSMSRTDDPDAVTGYRVGFVGTDDVRYEYEVEAADWGIRREELISYPKGTRRLLFRRFRAAEEDDAQFVAGPSLSGPTEEVRRITQPVMLYLATANKYRHKGLLPAIRALLRGVGIVHLDLRERLTEDMLRRVVMEMVKAPGQQEDLARGLLAAADVGITGVSIHSEKIPGHVLEQVRRILQAINDGDDPGEDSLPPLVDVVEFVHSCGDGESFMLPVEWESAGTIAWLVVSWHVLGVLRRGGVLLIDELDASLHPSLARYVVELFGSTNLNRRGAQLVFTTHDASLLSNSPTKVLEPRSVWFAEKSRNGHSELYSMADFDNRERNNNEKRYLAGKFGAVPDIDESLLARFLVGDADGS